MSYTPKCFAKTTAQRVYRILGDGRVVVIYNIDAIHPKFIFDNRAERTLQRLNFPDRIDSKVSWEAIKAEITENVGLLPNERIDL